MTDLLNDMPNPDGNLISYTSAKVQQDKDLARNGHSADGLFIIGSFRDKTTTDNGAGLNTLQNGN